MATDYLYDQLAPIGQQSVVLAVALLICQVVVFVLGVILAISIFYFFPGYGDLAASLSTPTKWWCQICCGVD